MKINTEFLNDPKLKNAMNVIAALAAGAAAVSKAFADQKKEQEFQDLKKAVAKLQEK